MVIQNVSFHTPRNVIHDGSLAYTLTFTHLDGQAWWVWRQRQPGFKLQHPVPTFEYKTYKTSNFIKQNYATFYLWDPQDDKSEQDY